MAADEGRASDAVRHQLNILRSSGVSVDTWEGGVLAGTDVIVDAIFGYSLDGPMREPAASLVQAINESGAPVVSNDIPTGIDATSGAIHEPAIHATATVTIALPKTGLLPDGARLLTGDLYLGDISVPSGLYERSLGIAVAKIFAESQIVKISGSR